MDEISRTLSSKYDKASSFVRFKQLQRARLEWTNLTYTIPVGRGKSRTTKTILYNLSASVAPGRLVIAMGPTGSGKTSFVNALAGRLPKGGFLEGDVLVNGAPRTRAFAALSAYVMQDDLLFSNLTVRETFEFAVRMRLPREVSHKTKLNLVDEIIKELGLKKAEDTRIGNEFVRGVSGGERKRTNIGIELLSNPSLLFLDEPTSGLDAFQAQNVMETLWTLANGGRTVVATLHQPRSSIYKMIDLLLLLTEGRCAYFGPAQDAVAWFGSAGFPCPEEFNPADFFLDLTSVDYRSTSVEEASKSRVLLLTDLFALEGKKNPKNGEYTIQEAENTSQFAELPRFPNTPAVEFWLLLQRAWKQSSRDRLPQIITLVQSTVIGFVLAALYSDTSKNQTGIQDETGILFFVAIFSAFNGLFSAINTFPGERGVINRERSSKAYHVLPYYIARFICDMPLRIFQALLFSSIIYWIAGLNPSAAAYFIFCCVIIMEALAAQGLGIAISAACKNEKVALAVAPAVTIILMLFGGFYVNSDSIPVWLFWIRYLSYLYYAFMGLVINDFEGRTGWTCSNNSTGCITTGDEIVDRLGFGSNELWQAFLGLGALIVFYNALGYLFLRITKPKYLPLTKAKKDS